MGKRARVLVVAAILTLGACGAPKRASQPAEPRQTTVPAVGNTTTRPPSTTATSTPEYSFDGSVPAPAVVDTGTDYLAIGRSLAAQAVWSAAHHPDPALVSTFVAPGTALFGGYVNLLTALRDQSQRFVDVLGARDQLAVVSHTADAFSATLVQHITARRVVDAAGRVVREARFRGVTRYLLVAVRVGGHWRLASTDVTDAPEQVA